MAAAPNPYSRFVAVAKVVLPLAALGLFATLFLLARQIDPSAALPYAEVDVEELAREARIGAPRFAGVTEDGTAVTLSAAAARPDPDTPGRMTAEKLSALLESPGGSTLAARARTGAVDDPANRAELTGGVEIATSSGWRLNSEALDIRLDVTEAVSPGPVRASGPAGTLDAGAMEYRRDPEDPARYVVVFSGGVKLVYRPRGEEGR
jgi:lipopolysaccharide export system protein LptC